MLLFATPENPLPEGAAVHRVRSRGGVELRAMTAPAAESVPVKGTVVILNGRADFMERYFETMRDLQQRGYAVAGFDWRGQGGSSRLLADALRGYVRSFADYDADLATVMETVVLPQCPGPYFALGHSTGGHVLLRALFNKTWFERAVVTAPLLGLVFGNWHPAVAKALAHAGRWLGLAGARLPGFPRQPYLFREFEGNPLSHDERRWWRDLRTLKAHEELAVGAPTYGWLSATLASLAQLKRMTRRRLQTPVLLVLAGKERVVDNRAAMDFVRAVPGASHLVLRDSAHEILLERDEVRRAFFAAFDAFVNPPQPES